ncbi:cysteine hydrolase family protein [Thermaerobacillus caldiproteolyticus]|uniref:Nicotinamidase-related amidase n=1 Tax=Thermaerobacillus caldiproteolyticus TaxID=247480 RepID=A0A7V9Z688_9BACL|nr:cysteine hydrolase family protein [Anoxybacillus caldiproteolyticus]MBA2874678.1 nicotinamidase-related amidase [Anoxybacillus caldiproteolyticus]
MNTALIIIDIQNDYFPNGKMELEGSVEASQRARQLLSFFREKSLPIFHIQHISTRSDATFFLPNTEGVQIHKNVEPFPNEVVIQKNYPNSFRDTKLLEQLRNKGINRLVICGMMTHMCIDATVRAAFDFGFECIVIHDACATKSLRFNEKTIPAEYVHNAILASLNGIYAKVISVEQFFAQNFIDIE